MNKWTICPACHGEGSCVNPDIDSNGLTAEDFADDPDFAEGYMSGLYDIRCTPCGGSGKVLSAKLHRFAEAAADRRLAAQENGDWEAYRGAADYRYGF